MLLGSLVELHVGLHSCLSFSLLEKLLLKASSTPPRHLLDTWLSVELPSFFLSQSRHLVGRSRNFLSPRQLFDTWWIDRASSLMSDVFVPRHFLDTCIYRRKNPRHLARHLYLSRITEDLYIRSSRSDSHFFNLSAPVHLPNTISLTPNLFPSDSSSFFKFSFTQYASNLLHLHAVMF